MCEVNGSLMMYVEVSKVCSDAWIGDSAGVGDGWTNFKGFRLNW